MAAIGGAHSQRTSSKSSLQTIWEGTEGTESEPDSASSETNAQEGTEVLTSKADDLKDIVAGSKVRPQLGIFQVQFLKNPQYKKDRRGQQPFCGDCHDLRDIMAAYGPVMANVPRTNAYSVVQKATTSMSMFGMLPGSVTNAELERQGLPNLRYQIKGKRMVACVSFTAAKQFAESKGTDLNADILGALKDVFQSMDDVAFDAFASQGLKVYRCTLEPGDLFFVPFGYIVFEQVLEDMPVYGLRTACFTDCNAKMFGDLVESYINSNISEPALLKFWLSLLSIVDSPRCERLNQKAAEKSDGSCLITN